MSRLRGLVPCIALLAATGCTSSLFAPRVIVVTGTTLGIKATPGDGQTRPPQFVIGYKRAEAALIPVDGVGATKTKGTGPGTGKPTLIERDTVSTVASFYLKSQWTDTTEVRSFIGTGFAAQNIVDEAEDKEAGTGGSFAEAFKKAVETIAPKLQSPLKPPR